MKKFISIAATLLLAASFNTAFAEYYLSGEFNNWGRKSFVGNTLIMDKKIRGEFKIIDNDTWYGAYQNNTLTSANPSATLDVGNASNLNLEFPSVYTFTISENNGTKTLTVSGFPTEGFYITGNFNDWKPEEMTKNSDGTYSIEEQLNDHALLKFRDYEGKWYDGVAEGRKSLIANIIVSTSNMVAPTPLLSTPQTKNLQCLASFPLSSSLTTARTTALLLLNITNKKLM